MPKVSVVIPVYGVEQYIERCSRSLFEQTIDDIEYIFVDDCSPDKSIDVLKTVLKDYPGRVSQVRIVRMEKNSGQAAVRKYGMELATGDFIIHCDSDDWVETDMYESMYNNAVKNNADMVVCDFEMSNGMCLPGSGLDCEIVDRLTFIKSMFYRESPWSLCNKIVKTSLLSNVKYHPLSNMGEDMVYTLQLTYCCKTISYIRRPLYHYYVNTASISRKQGLAQSMSRFLQGVANMKIIDSFFDEIPESGYFKEGMDFARFNKKRFLDLSYKECRNLWRKTYPFVELKVALDRKVNLATKKKAVKCFLQAYIVMSK